MRNINLEFPLPDHVTLPEIELSLRLNSLNVFPVKSRASVPIKSARTAKKKTGTAKKKAAKKKASKKKAAKKKTR